MANGSGGGSVMVKAAVTKANLPPPNLVNVY